MKPEELLSHTEFLQSLARSLVSDEHLAADIVQETCAAAVSHPPGSGKPARAWLSKVAHNFARIFHRSEYSRRRRELAYSRRNEIATPEEIAAREEVRQLITQAVLGLNEPYRSAILLRFYEDLPPREISRLRGLPVETVNKHLRRGIEQLRTRLDDRHGGDRMKWLMVVAPVAGLDLEASAASAATGAVKVLTGVLAMTGKAKLVVAASLLLGLVYMFLNMLPGGRDDSNVGVPNADESASISPASEPLSSGSSEGFIAPERENIPPLQQKLTCKGSVLSWNGQKGIPGAKLEVSLLPHDSKREPFEIITDAGGRLEAAIPSAGDEPLEGFMLSISADGYLDLRLKSIHKGEGDVHDFGTLYLEENRKLRVRIVDASAKPLAGARVEVEGGEEKIADQDGIVPITSRDLMRNGLPSEKMLRVRAEGMCTCYVDSFTERTVPGEIRLEPVGYWSSHVVDAEEGTYIKDAMVKIIYGDVMRWSLEDHVLQGKTDESGRFSIERVTWQSDKLDPLLSLRVHADGYSEFSARSMVRWEGEELEIPEIIPLRKISKYMPVRIVDAETDGPLSSVRVSLDSKSAITDEEGFFDFPVIDDRKVTVGIQLTGYKRFYRELTPSGLKNSGMTIRLDPEQVDEKISVRVEVSDELAHPVAGASVRLSLINSPREPGTGDVSNIFKTMMKEVKTRSTTNQQGIASFGSLPWKKGDQITLSITCSGFIPYADTPFSLEGDSPTVRRIILERGRLYQKIRVVDDLDEPVPFRTLEALLCLKDGGSMNIQARANERGLCQMVFPPFRKGSIFVSKGMETELDDIFFSAKRLDAVVHFTPDDLDEGCWLLVKIPENPPEEFLIQGVVRDENGKPLEGLSVSAMFLASVQDSNSTLTDENGYFRLFAWRKDLECTVQFTSILKGDRYFKVHNERGVKAGSRLDVEMASLNLVRVDYSAMKTMKNRQISDMISPRCWLESEDGTRVRPVTVERPTSSRELRDWQSPYTIYFAGVPAGRMRAVMETGEDKLRSYSPYIEVEENTTVDHVVKITQ